MNMRGIWMQSFVISPNLFLFIFMSTYISTSHCMGVGGTTHASLILHCVHTHTHTVLWCGTIRSNGNVFHERPLLWMCESDWEADKLQHPAKCQNHGGHKWLWAHCRDTLGTLLSCPAIHNLLRRSGVEQMFDSGSVVWSVDRWVVAELWKMAWHSLLCCLFIFWASSSLLCCLC